jgi:hypothetical protein
VLDADHVCPGDESIDVVDLVGENQLDVARALDVGCIAGQRAAYHANRNGKCLVGMLDTVAAAAGDTKNVRSDRPADRSDKRGRSRLRGVARHSDGLRRWVRDVERPRSALIAGARVPSLIAASVTWTHSPRSQDATSSGRGQGVITIHVAAACAILGRGRSL